MQVNLSYLCLCKVFKLLLSHRAAAANSTSSDKNIDKYFVSNQAAKNYLPRPNPAKTKKITIALEFPYSIITPQSDVSWTNDNGILISTDAVIEMAVSIVNNSTEILPDTLIEIARVNNRDQLIERTGYTAKSSGYAMNEVFNFIQNKSSLPNNESPG